MIILTAQIPDLLGLSAGKVPGDFPGKVLLIARHIGSVNPYAAGISLGSDSSHCTVRQKFSSRMPGAIVALLAGTALAQLFQMPVETIGSRFRGNPVSLSGTLISGRVV